MTTPDTPTVHHLDSADRLADGSVNPYYLEDRKWRVSVARVGGKLFAFDDLCTHEACPLSAGILTGTTILCQCHGCRYDITTGAVLNGPAIRPLTVYPVSEANGVITISY
ncbi:Rieske (2Fe-2S) protein [Mycolicibacterium setense]|uniref:Rieske (2Fe-2S) protein n=1 Tax=Mycolicibacterium setense TaxID=431269 RepID=UPI00068B0F0A|nr:Rieske (2Fe-2S) protein [Mycolicibacterium setense]MCV7115389.1 Rieske (2Fe-2S) protein [Mycolicibacterium setense]